MKNKIFCYICILFALINIFIPLRVNAETNSVKTNVIFVGDVPKNIYGDLYLTAMSLSDKQSYTFYLRDISTYTTYEYLPEGTYRIVEGGKPNDVLGEFQIEFKTFEISGENTIVTIKFGPDSNKDADSQSNTSKNISNESSKEIKDSKSIWDYLKWVVCALVAAGIVFFVLKFKKYFKNEI